MALIKLLETEKGVVYRVKKPPSTMFEFVLCRGKKYADGTHKYDICVKVANVDKTIKLASLRGHRSDAKNKLEEIIKQYV